MNNVSPWLRALARSAHQRRIDFEFVARSTVAGLCRTRMIGGQLQKRVLIAKPLAPVGKLPFLLPASIQLRCHNA